VSDHDMIKRGDAAKAVEALWDSRRLIGGEMVRRDVIATIAALPADDRVAKLVEALRWVEENAGFAHRDNIICVARAAIKAWEAGK